ncbi:ClC family H(+)/Cl(-) exchange transporter [Clostridium chrysemydis]|uniref:ClC family H(+)/Cl(-) exchange transporter n=1 Tax=Clostridium chrysemydis TaxID=2665504 RepID=UPI00188316F3|nr:ClC family H(+)/Cl(-) exchange transporter [Clostridium chrysemydis]
MESRVSNYVDIIKKIRFRTVIQSVLIGAITGLVVSLYRVAIINISKFTFFAYKIMKNDYFYMGLGIIVFLFLGYILGRLLKKEPMISGSGIPQIEGLVKGYLVIKKPIRVFLYKFIGGIIAIGPGLSLGIEGPSIQLGATVAEIYGKITKRIKLESRFLISAGAGAGLAAAFNAPFAGVMFVLEEVHKSFSPVLFLSAIGASVTSDLVTWIFFGSNHILTVDSLLVMPAKYYILVVILGLVTGIGGVIYNNVLIKTINLYRKIKLPVTKKMMIPFIITFFFGLYLPQVLGGGELVINSILTKEIVLKLAIILLIGKFTLSMASFASGTPGGILFPLLTLGALIGGIFGQVSLSLFNIDKSFLINFMLLAMAGMFSSIVRAPITGLILVCEMSGSFVALGPLAVVVGVAYLTAESLNCEPVYDTLLRFRLATNKDKTLDSEMGNIMVSYTVDLGSPIVGVKIKNIDLVRESRIITIETEGTEVIPNGNTVIKAGDKITAIVDGRYEERLRNKLEELCKTS